jgi:CubicO group peptidase (beta-lactamase class C family)
MKQLLTRKVIFSILILIGPPALRADTPAKLPTSFDPAAIDAYVAGQLQAKGYIGLSLAVAREGNIILSKAYGKRSLDPPAAVQTDTPFSIGSITKQFVSACILMLAEEGKLSVHDPVARYYPNLTRAQDITLFDLMSHTSGYPDYYPLDFVDRRMMKPISADALIHEYASGKLDFEPGTRWSYSNTGYIILGRVIERVSGLALGTFLEQRIFKPVRMEHTYFVPKPEQPRLARGYTAFALGPPELAPMESPGWLDAAGGIFSTATDLVHWDLALAGGQVLKPDSYRLMTTPRKLKNDKTVNYGCGVRITQQAGETIVQHGGAISGFLAFNAMIPRTRSAIVLLSNTEDVRPGPLQESLLSLLIKDQAQRDGPVVPKVQGPSPKEAALAFFHEMQAGRINRSKLGEEFNHFLNDDRIKAAAARYKPLGEAEKIEVTTTSERGGMETASVHFTFKSMKLGGILYRSPDGRIQQLLLHKE